MIGWTDPFPKQQPIGKYNPNRYIFPENIKSFVKDSIILNKDTLTRMSLFDAKRVRLNKVIKSLNISEIQKKIKKQKEKLIKPKKAPELKLPQTNQRRNTL